MLTRCLFQDRRHLEDQFDYVVGFFSVDKLKHKLLAQMTSTEDEGQQQSKKKQ